MIVNNSAFVAGGGSYYCALNNCTLTANSAGGGGGSYYGLLNNCTLTRNSATAGGGCGYSILNNCTVTGNKASQYGGGSYYGTLNNCIVWGNSASVGSNYSGGTLNYTCASPLAAGPGNRAADPQWLADGVHLAATSPCRGAGSTNYTSGTDIDGQPWASPPSMGCDEWHAEPAMTAVPLWQFGTGTGQALLVEIVAGQGPFYCWWTRDGVAIEDGAHYGEAHGTNLLVHGLESEDAGGYQVVVSNAYGMATSLVARLVVHCVDVAGSAPAAPYTNWVTAATNIQAAVDAAAAGEVVLVTNGVYSSSGKVEAGDLTNRVVLDKAVALLSVNGPPVTIIQGRWDPVSTNGPGAVRCAWLTNGAVLNGFTMRGGATRSTGDPSSLRSGGGVWCFSTNAVVANCVLTDNSAYYYGGGSSGNTLNNCMLTGNSASSGGGASGAVVNNCTLTSNSATCCGGGSYYGMLNNCTLSGNSASQSGGGSYFSTLNNCIVWGNAASLSGSNYYSGSLNYTCASPLASGPGNIAADPQLVDGVHLAVTSPCRGEGSTNYVSGTDIDGEPWATPPSMGCDEVWETGLTGSLAVAIQALQTEAVVNRGLALTGQVSGRAARLEWGFGDGPAVTNAGWLVSHAWTNTGDYTVTLTAYNTDNPGGVTTSVQVHVVPLVFPLVAINGTGSNAFQLSFGSQAGVNYVVEYTTNLAPSAVWQTLKTLTSTGGVITVQDPNYTNGACFYRVRMP